MTTPGYSGTPLWKKLGYKSGLTAYVDGAPEHYRALLDLPEDIRIIWSEAPRPGLSFVHFFSRARPKLKAALTLYRKKIAPDGVVWISWPKKSSGVATDITEDVIRELALPLGFVDIKVCAVDEVWSGLKLMIRKEQRSVDRIR